MTNQPWLQNKAWAKNQIHANDASTAAWFLGFALFIALVSTPALLALPQQLRQENYLILLVFIFPLIGLSLLIAALRIGLQYLRFGRSALVLDPFPAVIGGHCGGQLVLAMPYQANNQVSLKLQCHYSYVTRSGNKSRRSEKVVWYQEGYGYCSYAAGNKTQVRFCFALPANLPQTQTAQRDYHYWSLQLRTQINDKQLQRTYRIPVFKIERPASAYRNAMAIEHPANAQRVAGRIEQLQWRDDGKEIFIRHRYLRRFAERLGIMLFGSIFLASGLGIYAVGAPIIFPIIFVPIGLAFVLSAFYALVNRYDVTVTCGYIKTQRTVLGLIHKQKQFNAGEILNFSKSEASVWQGQQGNQRHFYSIKATTKSGKDCLVIEKLEGKAAADEVIKLLSKRLQNC